MKPKTDHSPMDGWDAQRRDALDRALRATPAQRLRWLEEAISFAVRTGALPRSGGATQEPSTDRGEGL